MKRLQLVLVGLTVAVTAAFVMQLQVSADMSGASVQGYASDQPLDKGTIVKLVGEDSKQVAVVGQKELQNMFGVVVDPNRLPVRISNSGLKNEAYVAVSGTHNVLVSTQGGAIEPGDHVTLSSISGIAMKAGTKEPTVFGRAAGSFDGRGVVLGTAQLKDVKGSDDQTVKLGSIPVVIDIKRNPNDVSTKVRVPEPLERVGKAIAEKEVSPIRIYLSMAIAVVSLVAAIVVLYAGVRNGVISIGRNPMTKRSIFRALLEIIFTSLLILIVGLFAVYLLLKL